LPPLSPLVEYPAIFAVGRDWRGTNRWRLHGMRYGIGGPWRHRVSHRGKRWLGMIGLRNEGNSVPIRPAPEKLYLPFGILHAAVGIRRARYEVALGPLVRCSKLRPQSDCNRGGGADAGATRRTSRHGPASVNCYAQDLPVESAMAAAANRLEDRLASCFRRQAHTRRRLS